MKSNFLLSLFISTVLSLIVVGVCIGMLAEQHLYIALGVSLSVVFIIQYLFWHSSLFTETLVRAFWIIVSLIAVIGCIAQHLSEAAPKI